MNYELSEGIVFTKICGGYFLIPNRQAAEEHPQIHQLSLFGAALMENIVSKKPIEDVVKAYKILTRKTEEESQKKISEMLEDFLEKGLIKETVE